MAGARQPPAAQDGSLRRSLGLLETTLGGVGIILGAGIYALVGAVAREAGSGLWLSFLIAAAMAATIGLCYAELASTFPRAGADYEYTRQAMGGRAAFVIGWLMVIGNVIAASAVALAFGGYLGAFVSVGPTPAALGALAVATLISFYGVRQAVWVSVAGTIAELAGLALVISVGLPHLDDLNFVSFDRGAGGVLGGASLVMFAFLGFSQVATLAEEAEDAARVIPRAMLLSIAACSTLYILVSLSALAVLGAGQLAASDAPLADVVSQVLDEGAADLIAVIALFSTANTMLLLMVAASRLIYGMASTSALPRFLAWIHPRVRTPARAIILSFLLAGAFACTGDLSFVAGATNFAVFVGFAAVCLSLILLRRRHPHDRSHFRAPFTLAGVPLTPVLGLLLTLLLLANLEGEVLLLGAGLFLSGVAAMELLSLWRPAGDSGPTS